MNHRKYDALVKSQSATAIKVLLAVSTEYSCSSRDVYRVLSEQGHMLNIRVIEGCLGSLKRDGLLKEQHHRRYVRVVPSENPVQNEAEEETVDEEAVSAPTASIHQFPDLSVPIRLVPNEETYERDRELEYYFNIRYERVVRMLKLLSERVPDELGLAILDVAEELDDNHGEQLEYFSNIDCPPKKMGILNPGWYAHEIGNMTYYNRKETLTPEEIEAYKAGKIVDRHATVNMDGLMDILQGAVGSSDKVDQLVEEETDRLTKLFNKFEPQGPDVGYFSSFIERIKENVPDIEPVAEEAIEEPIEVMRTTRKIRRGMCDIKIDGISQAPEYRAWINIVSPANVEACAFAGLVIDETWLKSFKAFLQDNGYRPVFGARLFRINKADGYHVANLEWRKEGVVIPARRRAPNGWPLMNDRDRAKREIRQIAKAAESMIDRTK
jgi:hypothetical protein